MKLRFPLLGAAWLCAILLGCGDRSTAPGDDSETPRASLLIVIVDEAAGWKIPMAGGSDATVFERHYADRPLTLALPALAERFGLAGYSSFAITGQDPPAVLQKLTLVVDETVDAAALDDAHRLDALRVSLERHGAPFLGYLRLRRDPAAVAELLRASPHDGSVMLVVTTERAMSGSLTETAIRVPLVVGFPAGARSERIPREFGVPTGHTDLALALMRWCGVGDDGSRETGDMLSGEPPDHVFVEDAAGWAVLSGDLKLTETSSGPRLHDLSRDPAESLDLAAQMPDEVERLREMASFHLDPPHEDLDPAELERLEELRSLGYIQ